MSDELISKQFIMDELSKMCEDCADRYCEDCMNSTLYTKIWSKDGVGAVTHEEFLKAAKEVKDGINSRDLPVVNVTCKRLERRLFGSKDSAGTVGTPINMEG